QKEDSIKYKDFLQPLEETTVDVGNIQQDVRLGDVFEADSSGVLHPKYKNYKGAFGNEDRLAKQQGTGEKVWKGFTKFIGKTLVYGAQSLGTLTYGVYSAIRDSDINSLISNDLTDVLDDAEHSLDRNFAHYYTDEEKARGTLSKMATANFWFDQVGDGLAFIGGALLPDLVLAPVTGGLSAIGLGGSAARTGAKLGAFATRSAFREGGEAASKALLKKGLTKEAVNASEDLAKKGITS